MAKRKIEDIPEDNVNYTMICNYSPNLEATHDFTFILAEIDSGLLVGAERTGVAEIVMMRTKCSLEEMEMSQKLQAEPTNFKVNGRFVEGKICFATKDRSLIDSALKGLKLEDVIPNQPEIYVLTKTTDEVNHQIVLNVIQHNLKHGEYKIKSKKDVEILHTNADRSYMEKLMLYFTAKAFDICLDELSMSKTEMKKQSWQLIQFSTKTDEIIFKVVPYVDTKWHNINEYQDVISFIEQDNNTYQAVMLFSSVSKTTIVDKFEILHNFIKSANLSIPYEIDNYINGPTAAILKQSPSFQRAEVRDTNVRLGILRNIMKQITDRIQEEYVQIQEHFKTTRELMRNLQHYFRENGISFNDTETPPSSDIEFIANDFE